MDIEINPCIGCRTRYDIKDINNMNSCCAETAAAFEGVNSTTNFNVVSRANCEACLSDSIKAIGRDKCNLRLTVAPVLTNSEIPHFFPDFLQKLRNPNNALGACIEACQSTRYPNDCEQKCMIDFNSVKILPTREGYSDVGGSGPSSRTVWCIVIIVLALALYFVVPIIPLVLFLVAAFVAVMLS